MLFFKVIFYFLIWCTDPAKIVKFQPEYIVVVQQSVTFTVEQKETLHLFTVGLHVMT